jgi:polysaccharide export outer membrane protein
MPGRYRSRSPAPFRARASPRPNWNRPSLKNNIRNPKVTVDVTSYRPFYVLGEVQKPGEYQFRSGLNVLSAIAIAGGATYRASTSTVVIQRSGSNELKEFPQSPTVLVMPGDVVRVPERYF